MACVHLTGKGLRTIQRRKASQKPRVEAGRSAAIVIASESIHGLADAIASSLGRSLAPLRRELAQLVARIDASSPPPSPREVREAAPAATVTAPRSAPRPNAAASAENCIVPDCE